MQGSVTCVSQGAEVSTGGNLQALKARGEKLSRLNDKAAELEAGASEYAGLAKELRRREEEKAKKGLFGGFF